MMDTPDKNHAASSAPLSSNFEDSPVFTYISNLSPIKPVKPHITQSFQSLNFAPVPSVFTSPNVGSSREVTFLKRDNLLDSSKDEVTSEDRKEERMHSGLSDATQLANCSADALGKCDTSASSAEVLLEAADNDRSNLVFKLPETLEHDYDSPNNNFAPTCVGKTGLETDSFDTPEFHLRFYKDRLQQRDTTTESEINLPSIYPLEQAKGEGPECDWENLISDTADLLIFDSLATPEASQVHDCRLAETSLASFVTKLQIDNVGDLQGSYALNSSGTGHLQFLQDHARCHGEVGEIDTALHRPILLRCRRNNSNTIENSDRGDKTDDNSVDSFQPDSKVDAQQQRGMRRRCLFFDMAGVLNKTLEDGLKRNSSTTFQSDGSLDDKQLVPLKPAVSSSPCMVPGIGLHLNTLATTSTNSKAMKQEFQTSGKHVISMPRSVTSSSSLTAVQKSSSKRLALSPVERDISPLCNEVPVMEDSIQPSGLGADEDSNQSSPKKKKRKLEEGDSESCKRCNCKKSKCLKLYCECFAAGVYCVEPCSCIDCYNKPIHEDTVLSTRRQIESRNPLAFAPKVVWRSETLPDMGEDSNMTPASARHKRGCNCKKSSCNKKYCECYQGGVGCSSSCRCEGCKNTFGVKDGLAIQSTIEAGPDEDSSILTKDGTEQSLPLTEVQKEDSQYTDSHLTITPFSSSRTLIKLSSFSNKKPPRSSLMSIGSARKYGSMNSRMKFDDHFSSSLQEDTPEILRGNGSPFGVKNLSPNSKRVSPPHHNVGLGFSPGMKSSRKLILQSIPPIPPNSPHGEATSDFPLKLQ